MHLKNIQYNELGQVISNSLHGNGLGDYLQSVDYRYNERGWLTRINELNTGSCIGRACTTTLSLKVMLEGPTIDNGMMNTGLNNRGLLPGQTPTSPLAMPTPDGQPYKAAPWGYPGIEGMMGNIDSLYTPETVDWILVSLRTGTTPDTEIFKTAALLQNDGTVQLTDEAALPDDMPPVYIVIEHSNHIGVMTPQPVTIENDSLIYDFTTADSYTANGVGVGQKYDPASGKWMMLAGEGATSEGEPSYDITGDEKSMWSEINGNFGEYFITDFDRNGDVNGGDKILWEANNGSSSRVPRNVLTAVPELDAGTGSIGPIGDPQSPPSAADDLFRMRIQYRYTGGALNATPQYNGNISHVRWQVNDNPADIKTYRYAYDQLDRLTEALYRRNPNYTADVDAYSVQDITYDLNGNIQTLKRNGGTNLDAIDDLNYGYNGNQLLYVDDATGNPEGFTDDYAGTEYFFDANGNMITDVNKGITNITYNHLNLPEVITLSGGTITFLYDANGNKLRKTVNGTSQDYLGGIEYSGGVVEAIYHEEGRATPSGTSWQYEYYLKDHLGNTRVIFTDANNDDIPEIIQEADYYPFGMRHQNATATNHYLYNGKELNRDLGLDWYDYGFRWYDMELGRFPSVDPLSSRFSSESNYSYAGNSPTVLIDVDGKFKFDPQTLSLLKTKYPTSYKYLVETRPGMPGNLLELADNVTVTKAMVTTSANYNLRRIFGSNAPWTEKDYFRSFQSDIFRLSVSQIKHDFTYGNGQYIKFVTHPGGLGAGTNESVGGYNHFNSGNSIDDFTDKQQQEKRIELNIGFLENIENATTDLEKQAGLAQLTSVLIHEYLEAYGDDGPVSFNYKGNEFSVGAYAAQYQIYGQGIPFSLTRPTWEGLGNYQSGIEAIEKAMHGGDMGVIPTLPK